MPYTPSTVPDYVPKNKAAQWAAIWNSVYKKCIKGGGSKETCESKAFKQANGKIKSQGNEDINSERFMITKLGWRLTF